MSGGSLNQPDPSTPGKLTCSMNMQCPICPDVPLWVVGLGPLYLNQYEWTIITDPKLLNLFILTRDVNRFETYYKDHVLSLVNAMGFNDCINEPHPTYQGEACQYTS